MDAPSAELGSDAPLRLRSEAVTHEGCVRPVNEDAHVARPELAPGVGLWAVADGMGGHRAGDVASSIVAHMLGELAPPRTGHDFLQDVRSRLEAANAAMLEVAAGMEGGAVVGSTVVALLAYGGHYACMWVGDSRAYLLRDGRLRRLTRDDSVVQALVDSGVLSPEQARTHRQANVLTRALGSAADLTLSLVEGAMQAGDVFLLCSDGLTGVLADEELAALMADPDRGPDAFLSLALERRAADNVTAVLVRAG